MSAHMTHVSQREDRTHGIHRLYYRARCSCGRKFPNERITEQAAWQDVKAHVEAEG